MRMLTARIVSVIAFGAIYTSFGSYIGDVTIPTLSLTSRIDATAPDGTATDTDTDTFIILDIDVRGGYQDDAAAAAAAITDTTTTTTTTMTADALTSVLEAATVTAATSDDDDDDDFLSTIERQRQRFLDRVRLVSRSLIQREKDAVLETGSSSSSTYSYSSINRATDGTSSMAASSPPSNDSAATDPNASITPQSDLMRPGRHMTVVTTAALPWMTGTAVNPILRAAHLVRMTRKINANNNSNNNNNNNDDHQWVTLVIPWLELEQDRKELYPHHDFQTPADQERYLREWLAKEADMPDVAQQLRIVFYPGRYHSDLKSIFAMGDITEALGTDKDTDNNDVCILEEPEHLNWFRAPGEGWSTKFHYVVGVVHTNYKDYASSQYHGLWSAPALAMISSAMVRAYCHKVIKLSDVLQTFAPEKESTSNVHGVRSEFIKEGMRRADALQAETERVLQQQQAGEDASTEITDEKTRGAYFIGKIIWQKGFDIMLEMQDYYKQCTGDYFPIHIYGSGPDTKDIMRAYHGRRRTTDEKGTVTSTSTTTTTATTTATTAPLTRKKRRKRRNKQIIEVHRVMAVSTVKEPSLSSFESLNIKAQGQLEKIKQTIRETEFDIPKTLHELRRQPIPATFPGRIDHAALKEDYSIFINPSVSEVLCTTTAEALAMGKFVIIPVHPSNSFFLQFPNCLAYRNKLEFVANLRWAQSHEPEPLTPELRYQFTWEAATERLVSASAITITEAQERERLGKTKLDQRIAWFHNEIGKGERGDTIRKVMGAGPVSNQVKYQEAQQNRKSGDIDADSDGDDDEEDEEGFSKKFFGSSISQALRTTLANGLPALGVPGTS